VDSDHRRFGKEHVIKDLDLSKLSDELVDLLNKQVEQLKKREMAPRDYSVILSIVRKIKEVTGESREETFRTKLQEWVDTSEYIEQLALGQPSNFTRKFGCRLVFDKGKKKPRVTIQSSS
jgi:hypothetical protein